MGRWEMCIVKRVLVKTNREKVRTNMEKVRFAQTHWSKALVSESLTNKTPSFSCLHFVNNSVLLFSDLNLCPLK